MAPDKAQIMENIADLVTLVRQQGATRGFRFWRMLHAAHASRTPLQTIGLPSPLRSITIRRGTSDWKVVNQIFVQGHYHFPGCDFQPKLILDCGANLGASALYFHAQFPEAIIHAIEPDQSNFELLTRNTEEIANIRTTMAAVWGDDAAVEIIDSSAPPSERSVRAAPDSKLGLAGFTVDSLLKASGFDRIGLLKLDVQGAEREIFTSKGLEWLERTDVIMIELHDFIFPGCSEAFYTALRGRTFAQFQNAHTILIDLRSRSSA